MDPATYLEAHADRFVDELIEFVRIPSVSTDPKHAADIEAAADWLSAQLRAIGPLQVTRFGASKHPLVYAEWLGAQDQPTVLIYGHYDVQPADPLEAWHSPPFRPTRRDGRLYARGVSDDKAPLFIALKVIEACFATRGRLPVNVKVLLEGEEEIGSPGMGEFIASNKELLQADFVLSADGGMWRPELPSLTLGSRGLIALELTVTGPSQDLHSGRHGGGVANPLHALATVIASLHDTAGRVAVEGFYDDVEELDQHERALLAALPFDAREYLQEVGAPELAGENGFTTLERQWLRPTLEVNGMWGGYQGEGTKTVLPSQANAKISCRLVPDQDPEHVAGCLERHLLRHAPAGVRLDVRGGKGGTPAYRIDPRHTGVKVAGSVLKELYGREPANVWLGGSLPICGAFKRHLGMDTVFFSFAVGDEKIHAPNEFFRLHRFREGLHAWSRYLDLLGESGSERLAQVQ